MSSIKLAHDEIVEDVERVANEVARTPTISDYQNIGAYSPLTVSNRFGDGSWRAALAELGFDVQDRTGIAPIPDADLQNDVHRVVEALGHPPTVKEYESAGNYSPSTIADRLGSGSWVTALRKLGYTYERANPPVTDYEVATDVRRVSDSLGRAPTQAEYIDYGKHSPGTVAERFGDGSWNAALETFGHEP